MEVFFEATPTAFAYIVITMDGIGDSPYGYEDGLGSMLTGEWNYFEVQVPSSKPQK